MGEFEQIKVRIARPRVGHVNTLGGNYFSNTRIWKLNLPPLQMKFS